jgi:hypothetical protein
MRLGSCLDGIGCCALAPLAFFACARIAGRHNTA